jgi:hypothetical protein
MEEGRKEGRKEEGRRKEGLVDAVVEHLLKEGRKGRKEGREGRKRGKEEREGRKCEGRKEM